MSPNSGQLVQPEGACCMLQAWSVWPPSGPQILTVICGVPPRPTVVEKGTSREPLIPLCFC